MGAYKSDINPFDGEFNNNNQSMMVAFDIKHVVLVSHVINTVKTLFYVSKIFPFG
jgi:hypothetical protein